MSRCPGWSRHWFTVEHTIGVRSPKCTRCGAPNPKASNFTTDDWWEVLDHAPHLLDDPASTREWLETLKDDVS